MVFSSITFLFYFLPVVLIAYFVSPKSMRNLVLFLASLFFYAWGEPVYVVLMLFSTVVDYTLGRLIGRNIRNGDRKKAKLCVLASVVINLSLLATFKYLDFIIGNVNTVFHAAIPLAGLALPIGISFYTFQTMSYSIDVYRGQAPVQKNIISFGAYVALFPQLIAGPIVRYNTIATSLNDRTESVDKFSYGILRFVTGLAKKVLLANTIGMLWHQISAMDVHHTAVLTVWLGIIAFTFQIYFDFSGYSDMAIGLGSMFGFKFLENFNYPYMARSITEFWRRWHISLSTWFKEYVYIPLGGNRKGIPKQIRNIAIVWLLTGIWHGASWNFAIWGGYFAVLLILEKIFLLKWLQKLPKAVSHIYTLLLVVISWVIFSFDKLGDGLMYIKAMFGGYGTAFADRQSLYLLSTNALLLLVVAVGATDYPKRIAARLMGNRLNTTVGIVSVNALVVLLMLLSVAYIVNASYNPFLYFRF